jgi:hypothetical protein
MIVVSRLRHSPGISIRLEWKNYENGRIALQGVDPTTYEPILRFSVNLPDRELEKDQIFIKDWSENEGALSTLVDAGIVEIVDSTVVGHDCTAYRCQILKRE